MTEDEIKLWNLYNKTEGTPWNCVPAWRGMVGEGGPIGYWMTTVPATEDPIQCEKNVEYMMAAANQAPRLLERLMTLEKELEDARLWQARFANDSEAYKQGVEDGGKRCMGRVITKLNGMEPNAKTAFKDILKSMGLIEE